MVANSGRTPQGVRGLKYAVFAYHPTLLCRTPQGVRGLKYKKVDVQKRRDLGRTPQGVRGLKYHRPQGR